MDGAHSDPAAETPVSARGHFFREDGPYIVMLAFAILGAALASVFEEATSVYWEVLVPLFAAICIYTRWRDTGGKTHLQRLLRIEALHWGAIFVAMRLVATTDVSHVMNANAISLVAMILLAVGTFTAGAQISSWRLCVVGAVLALAVPIVAWLTRATLLVTLGAIAAVSLAGFYVAHHKAAGAGAKAS